MDRVLYDIEQAENNLAYQNRMRDEAETQEQTEKWSYHIIETQKTLEKHRWAFGEVEALLKHTR